LKQQIDRRKRRSSFFSESLGWGDTTVEETTRSAVPRAMFEYRMSLRTAGFAPLPVAGKRPVISDWQTKNDTDAAEIASWGATFPGCTNTGILTARTPALDIDIKNADAADAVSELVRELFGDKGTLLTRFGETPKRAILFRTEQPFSKQSVSFTAPDGSTHKVEMLGRGQQIVVNGIHPNTRKAYSWHGDYAPGAIPWADLPPIEEEEAATLLALISEMLAEKFWFQEQQKNSGAPLQDAGDKLPVDAEAELAAMAPGSVNAVQVKVTASLLSRGVALEDVVSAVCNATLEMAARHGLAWTREEEINGSGNAPGLLRICTDWIKKLNDDYDHRLGEIPTWVPENLRDKWSAALTAGRRPRLVHKGFKAEVRSWEGAEIIQLDSKTDGGTPPPEQPAPPPKRFSIRPFVPFDLATLPPRQWLYGRHYQRRTVSATIAPGGFGKTTLGMVEAVAMATCRNLLNEQPEARLRVWLHNGEDNLDELNRRLGAICAHYGIPQNELENWFFMTSGNEVPLRVANGYNELRLDRPLIQCINDEIANNAIDIALLDPLITLHGVSEQDNSKMDTVIRIFAGIADAQDCAIGLAHHTRKQSPGATGADYGVDDMRGASAIRDAVRAARMLNQMSAKDAHDAGIADHERAFYFRVDRAKGNNAPPTKAVWRKFLNVVLPNGDDVGVVVPWDFPGQGQRTPEKDAADKAAEELFLYLLTKFTAQGINVAANIGPNYAPARFAKEKEARAVKIAKAALSDAMGRLLDAGRIRSEPYGRSDRATHRLVIVP
jgi:RecA-family ATPase